MGGLLRLRRRASTALRCSTQVRTGASGMARCGSGGGAGGACTTVRCVASQLPRALRTCMCGAAGAQLTLRARRASS